MVFPNKFGITFLVLVSFVALVASYIYEDNYPDYSVDKRNVRRNFNRVLSMLLQKDALDRNRRQPLGDFGVGSRWNAGSSAANYLQSSHFLNSPFSPGRRKRDEKYLEEDVYTDS